MRKVIIFVLISCMLLSVLCGCSLMDDFLEKEPEKLNNGTTTGNILNGGFAVKDGEDILFFYTGKGAYDYGSVVRSNPETGESSQVLGLGGLYMSLIDDALYYCRPDGVYKAALNTKEPELIMEGDVSQLQFSGSQMYYISNGGIESTSMDGAASNFSRIDDAAWLNIYKDKIYYADTQTGYIHRADMNGDNEMVLFNTSVDMFYILNDILYYVDSADRYIKRTLLEEIEPETVVAYPCSGFNVNRDSMYYTRSVDGKSLCCSADIDGLQENVIEDFGQSRWHMVCMLGNGAMVIGEETLSLE